MSVSSCAISLAKTTAGDVLRTNQCAQGMCTDVHSPRRDDEMGCVVVLCVQFFSNDVDLLGTAAKDGRVFIRRIIEVREGVSTLYSHACFQRAWTMPTITVVPWLGNVAPRLCTL